MIPETQVQAQDALALMYAAVRNMRLYPPAGAMAVLAVDRLYQTLTDVLAGEEKLIFTFSGKTILLCGEPLSPPDRQVTQYGALLETLIRFGIRSITLEKGLGRDELAACLEIIAGDPEQVKSEGGLPRLLAEKDLLHILIDQKVHAAPAGDGHRRISPGSDMPVEPFVRDIMRAFPELRGDPEQARKASGNPARLFDLFRSAAAPGPAQDGAEDSRCPERLMHMIRVLDRASAGMGREEREGLCRGIGATISGMAPEAVSLVLSGEIESLFGGALLQHIVSELDDIRFSVINEKLLSGGYQSAPSGPDPDAVVVSGFAEASWAKCLSGLKQAIAAIPNGADEAFLDRLPTASLPELSVRLADEDPDVLRTIVDRLSSRLHDGREDVRVRASQALAGIMEGLPRGHREALLAGIADRLVEWIRGEAEQAPAYEKICTILKDHVVNLTHLGRYEKAVPIVDVFARIRAGVPAKNVMAQKIAAGIIRDLASESLLGALFTEFYGGREGKRAASGRMLCRLGEGPLNRLLDLLRVQGESDKRVRILQVLGEVGPMVMPLIRERIREGGAWYYLRNLAYLLGRTGGGGEAGELRPLLLHEDLRVRREALRSVHRIGGSGRGPLLLSALPAAEDPARVDIVEMLGRLKCDDAVVPLLELLRDRPFIALPSRADLEEAICVALGRIGSPGAVRALAEIQESGRFFGVQPYYEKVIVAASRALASIRSRAA